ncbi:MAG: sigma-70 family RNA polymerase sigma factor [Planctomycetes bacterium]|nr:sigma-70 family RNA polymerase sigma factor [Planctomycetota bacterium]
MADRSLPDCLARSPLTAELELPCPFDARDDEQIDLVAAQLLWRFRARDDGAAFELLVEFSLGRLLDLAQSIARRFGQAVEADDLVARFLERLFVEPRPDEPEVRHFLGMAFQTMRYDALNQLRLTSRMRRRNARFERNQAQRRTLPDPASVVSERDHAESLLGPACVLLAVSAHAFSALRPHDRTILFHRELEGLSYDDLAEVMDIPRKQVGMILKRARERFVDQLEKVLRRASAHAFDPPSDPSVTGPSQLRPTARAPAEAPR